MRRLQKDQIVKDLKRKMVILVGPRQVGKTWLAKEIAKEYQRPVYLNYDDIQDRKTIELQAWPLATDLIIFDEIHKMPLWKNFVKGVYDTKDASTNLLVTGSARLETFRKTGDSMAGRFFVHHLLPFSFKETLDTNFSGDLERLLERGGFPEPFLAPEKVQADRWRQEYVDSLLREDVLDFSNIDKVSAMRNVFEIMRGKVGSPISYANIAGDVGVSPETVKKYVEIFEALYIIYLVRPYSKKINRAILKSPKIYFYDTGLIKGDAGAIFENVIANSLQKHILGMRDCLGQERSLMYVRTKEGKEVDFAIVHAEGDIEKLIEAKDSDREISKNLKLFSERLNVPGIQVVKNIRYGTKPNSLNEIREAKEFLRGLFL